MTHNGITYRLFGTEVEAREYVATLTISATITYRSGTQDWSVKHKAL